MYATVNGARVFFDIAGSGVVFDGDLEVERPVVVMLPGGPGSSHTHYKRPSAGFHRLLERFQLVYVDWRGGGRSDSLPPDAITLDNAVADVEAIRQLLGIEQWAVLGASGGGIWALAYAAAHPDVVTHLLILHSTSRCDYFATTAEAMARKAGITDEEAIGIYRDFVSGRLEAPVEEWAASLRDTIMHTQNANYSDPDKHPEVTERRTKGWKELPTPELLKELDVSRWYLRDFQKNYDASRIAHKVRSPTLVITGETDPVAPPSQAEELERLIPGAELYVHSGGHMPHGDEQGPFFERILEFLARPALPRG